HPVDRLRSQILSRRYDLRIAWRRRPVPRRLRCLLANRELGVGHRLRVEAVDMSAHGIVNRNFGPRLSGRTGRWCDRAFDADPALAIAIDVGFLLALDLVAILQNLLELCGLLRGEWLARNGLLSER